MMVVRVKKMKTGTQILVKIAVMMHTKIEQVLEVTADDDNPVENPG